MPNKGKKCPNCGNNDPKQFNIKDEEDLRETVIICKKCGKKGTVNLFSVAAYNPFVRKADGHFSDQDMKLPSNKTDSPNNKNNPAVLHGRETDKKNRKKPESRINPKLDETENENTRRVSMRNPFVKKSQDINEENSLKAKLVNHFNEIGKDTRHADKIVRMIDRGEDPDKILKYFDDVSDNTFGIESVTDENSWVSGYYQDIVLLYANTGDTYDSTLCFDTENQEFFWGSWGDFVESLESEKPEEDDEIEEDEEPEEEPEEGKGNWRIHSMKNPFLKESNKKIVNFGEKTLIVDNPFIRKAKDLVEHNPFIKKAREFKRTDQQLERKMDKNMVFPESKQDVEDNDENKNTEKLQQQETIFDTVDRKDYRNSPDPKTFIPGYKEWYDREIDKYYDGWVDDHIENSGGKVVGSNTEKTMNLNDGERNHPPVFPTEAVYEALLEGRHQLDGDLVKVVAEEKTYTIKKSDVESILKKKIAKEEETNDVSIDKALAIAIKPFNSGPWSYVSMISSSAIAGKLVTKSDVKNAIEELKDFVQDGHNEKSDREMAGLLVDLLEEKLPETANLPTDYKNEFENYAYGKKNPFTTQKKAIYQEEEPSDIFIDEDIAREINPFHGGQFSAIYGVSSTALAGKPVRKSEVENAIKELKQFYTNVQNKYEARKEALFLSKVLTDYMNPLINPRNEEGFSDIVDRAGKDVNSKKNPFTTQKIAKDKKKNKKNKNKWWMSGPNSGLGNNINGGDGAGGEGGPCGCAGAGTAAKNNPFAKQSKKKEKTQNQVRIPHCPNDDDTLVHSEGNHLYMCPSSGEVVNEKGNSMGLKQPEWKSKKKK